MADNYVVVENDKGEISVIRKAETKHSFRGNDNYFVYALSSDDELCFAGDSEKGKDYYCPSCGESVILRKGKIKIHHFAHRSGLEGICSYESIIHKTAKILIKKVVSDWIEKKSESPSIVRKCQGSCECSENITQKLPERVDGVELEYKLENGKIADVVLLSGSEIVSAIEIRVSHKVEEINVENYVVPFIELDGKEVIENSMVWKPLVDKFKKVVCRNCFEGFKNFFFEASRIAKRDKITLPKDFYRYGLANCWKCGEDILIFAFPSDHLFPGKRPKVYPIPKSIKMMHSQMAGQRYYANTCLRCGALQGNYFSHIEPDGAFFGVMGGVSEDNPGDFKQDQYKIAMRQGRWIKKQKTAVEG